jgi:hypothetical protein
VSHIDDQDGNPEMLMNVGAHHKQERIADLGDPFLYAEKSVSRLFEEFALHVFLKLILVFLSNRNGHSSE